MTLFDGLSAFPITPADQNGRVDTQSLDRIIERLKATAVNSIGLLGSTGTYVYLTRSERCRAVETAATCLAGSIPLIVGVGTLRTDAAVDLAQDAERAGADGLLLAPVSYTPLTKDEVFHHFEAVAAATDLPLCIYNNPGTTNFAFDASLLERLAAVAGIAAVKMPLPADGDLAGDLANLRSHLPETFRIGYSGDWGCADALLAGADAWYSVIGGTLPGPAVALTRAAMAGDRNETHRINALFQPLWDLFQEFGSLRVVYAIAHQLGLTKADLPRPLLPLGQTDQERVTAALSQLNLGPL